MMNDFGNFGRHWILCVVVLAAVGLSACSRKPEEPAVPAPVPNKQTSKPKPITPPISTGKPGPVRVDSGTGKTVPVPPEGQTPENPAMDAATIETKYLATKDFAKRVEAIYDLSDLDSPEALASLGRIFQVEKDPELKIEVLDSLTDIEGHDDTKANLLRDAVRASQPKEVRESAVDNLADISPKLARPILQSLLNDRDEDIRDQAKDVLEQLDEDEENAK